MRLFKFNKKHIKLFRSHCSANHFIHIAVMNTGSGGKFYLDDDNMMYDMEMDYIEYQHPDTNNVIRARINREEFCWLVEIQQTEEKDDNKSTLEEFDKAFVKVKNFTDIDSLSVHEFYCLLRQAIKGNKNV